MKIAEIAIRRPVTTCMFIACLMLLGIISWQHLPVQLFPDLVLPVLGVWAGYYPGFNVNTTPEDIEENLTIPIENAAASLPRVKKISSSTWSNGCWAWIEMGFGGDMRFAAIDLQEKLEALKKDFPRGAVRFRVMSIDTAEFQKTFMSLVIKGTGEQAEIRAVALDTIQQRLEDIPGISRVQIGGYSPERVYVRMDENRLREHRVPFQDIVQSVQEWSSPEVYLGEFKTPGEIYFVRIAGRYENLFDLSRIPLGDGRQLRLADLADIDQTRRDQEREWIYRYEGKESIGIDLEKEALANPVVTARRVRREIESIQDTLPEGYEIKIHWDDAETIEKVIRGVTKLALLGAALAMVVLLLFLRNLRAALIVLLSIPVSIISTFNLMYFAGFSFNLFSLVGLAFGIGMLVDNSIVVLENIYRHYRLTGDRRRAALRGTQEVARPILASTLTTVIVFIPILFVDDITRLIFKEMSLSIVFPIVMSLVVAYTFVPMAASTLLALNHRPSRVRRLFRFLRWIPFYRIIALIPRGYRRSLRPVLRHPMQMILIVLFLIFYAWGTRHRIAEGYLTRDVEDDAFHFWVTLPEGTKTETTSRVSQQVEEMLGDYADIKRYGAWIRDERSSIYVRLKDADERKMSADEILEDVLERTQEIPEAIVSPYWQSQESPAEIEIPYGGGGSIEIRGPEQKRLLYLSSLLSERIQTIPGIREVRTDLTRGQPELRLIIDRQKAALLRVNASQIAQAVQSQRKGGQVSEVRLHQDDEEIEILFELEGQESRVVEDTRKVTVFTGTGQTVPLGEICRLELGRTPGYIRRENQERGAQVYYALMPDQNLEKIKKEVEDHIGAMRIPPGYTIRTEREREDIDRLQRNLKQIVALGIILIFMVLASLFESFGAPFVVLLAIPLSVIGVVYGLIVMRNPFDVFGAMGVIVLVGIVVNNAILLLHFVMLKRREEGWKRSRAVVVSCLTRFRPIWMTTLTTTLGLVPLAMKTSGKSIWTPFAVVIIGGLLGSTLLTPYVIPAMYVFLENRWLALKRRFFWLLSKRWVLFFWSARRRNARREREQTRFEERFGRLRLPDRLLQTMPLEISARHLTMVFPERRGSAREESRKLLRRLKTDVLLPAPQAGIVPAGSFWLHDLTDSGEDPRSTPYGFKALDDLNFDVGAGMFGLLGPNGAGKTTLIRILATTLPPSRGRLSVGGYDALQYRQDLARIIGYLPQTFGFYNDFNPLQYLTPMAILKGLRRRTARREAIERVLRQVNLWDERRTPIGNFSGGMRQRLGIAQTLLTLPRIVIVDEPTAGLDPKERVHFRNLLAEISRGRIVILSTHIVEDISSSCNRVGIMDKGRLVFIGSLDELLSTAQGKVWEVTGSPEETQLLGEQYRVISQTVVSGGKRVRFLSETRPAKPATLVEPTVEDAYLYVRRSRVGEKP